MQDKSIRGRIASLLDVKSLVTLSMTGALIVMLFLGDDIPQNLTSLFSASYGSVITYFFTRKNDV